MLFPVFDYSNLQSTCSFTNNTGKWNIVSATGLYRFLRGGGSLLMTFPPDVPTGVLSIETMTGKVFLDGI
jgi:hypothetical protein